MKMCSDFFCSENHPFRCHLLDHLQVLMAAVHHLAKMLKHIHSHIIVATFQGKLTAATTSVSVCIGLSWSSGWAGTKFEKKSVCHCLRSQNVWLKEVNVLAWLTSECISRQSPSRPAGDLVIYPALGCHCFLTGPLKSVTILWPVPNYIGWGQRHIYVNNLPRVVTLWWNDWELNLRPLRSLLWLLNHQSGYPLVISIYYKPLCFPYVTANFSDFYELLPFTLSLICVSFNI